MTYSEFKMKYAPALNPQQDAAVQTVTGPVLLLAVPGSGKTTVLVTRLGYMLLCCGILPEQILTMTYTVAATADMGDRFASIFGRKLANRLEFRTINGISAQIIRHYEQSLGRKAFDLITDERELSSMIGEIYREITKEFATESTVKSIRTWITYIKNMQLSDQEIGELKVDGVAISIIYREYCRRLKAHSRMDYDDQMIYADRILRLQPEILRHFQNQYAYFCVDEAQDTSKIQHRIIQLLAGRSGNLFMVGDEDQSIYGFRAAYPEALLEFERTFPGAKVLLLERNYRSTRQIVEAADGFIQKNRLRRPKHMAAVRGSGVAIRFLSVYDRREQYRKIVELARDCKKETAVLYRNNDSALPIIDLLSREGVPYRCRQFDSTFFSHKIVRDITDIIHFAANPTNGEIFMRIYYKFNAGISKPAAELAVRRRRKPILMALAEMPDLFQRTRMRCMVLQTQLEKLLQDSGDRAIARIVYDMGYGGYLNNVEADDSKVPILEALGTSEPSAERLLARLNELAQLAQAGSVAPDSKFVLSTIHSSKGLEYDRVVLADVANGILPGTMPANLALAAQEELRAYEEERRLFYVGITRAKEELTIFRFQSRDLPSAFTGELLSKQEKTAPSPQKSAALPSVTLSREIPREIQWIAKDFLPGLKVIHVKYGPGRIEEKAGDIVAIRFFDGVQRRFSLAISLQQNQLKRDGCEPE